MKNNRTIRMRNGLLATLMVVGVMSGGCALSRSVSGLPEGARLIGGGGGG